jgi:NitT/TauT family transport system substrate-binding protein
MDLATFAQCAQAQKPLIETDQTKSAGLGTMAAQRWDDLAKQLTDLGVIDSTVKGEDCFVNP